MVAAFEQAGTPFITGIPGEESLEMIEAARQRGMRFILNKQESAAAMMSATWGELTGAPGVCLSTRAPGAANMVLALTKGTVDIARTATPYLIQDVLGGSDNVAILGETATPIYSLIAKPEIKSFADLKGKTIGLSLAVDTISISTRKLMGLNGIKEADIKVKELVGTPARADCLRKGECDAVPLGQPEDFLLIQQGYRRLGVSTDAMKNFQFIVSAVRRPWAEKNKDALVRYARALAAAYRYMREPAHREEVVAIVVDTTGSSAEIARQTLALYFDPDRGVVPKQGEIDVAGFNQVIQVMAEAGELKAPLPPAERFIDLQYLKAAGLQ